MNKKLILLILISITIVGCFKNSWEKNIYHDINRIEIIKKEIPIGSQYSDFLYYLSKNNLENMNYEIKHKFMEHIFTKDEILQINNVTYFLEIIIEEPFPGDNVILLYFLYDDNNILLAIIEKGYP